MGLDILARPDLQAWVAFNAFIRADVGKVRLRL